MLASRIGHVAVHFCWELLPPGHRHFEQLPPHHPSPPPPRSHTALPLPPTRRAARLSRATQGGNREHFAIPWLPQQPKWSALREYAYGWGTLDLNETHAVWTWLRNDDPWNPPGGRIGDQVVYETRP